MIEDWDGGLIIVIMLILMDIILIFSGLVLNNFMVLLEKFVNIFWNNVVVDLLLSLIFRFNFLNIWIIVVGESYNIIFLILNLIKNIKVIIEIFMYIV